MINNEPSKAGFLDLYIVLLTVKLQYLQACYFNVTLLYCNVLWINIKKLLHLKEILVRMDKKELLLLPLVKWYSTKEISMVSRHIEVAITDLLMHHCV